MKLYYLESPLTPDDLSEVEALLGTDVDQVRIPHILPAPGPDGSHEDRPLFDVVAVIPLLRKSGISSEIGKRVSLAIPADLHWYSALLEAVARITGYYPYLVQTEKHREVIGNPGPLRIIDAEALMNQ